MKTATKEIEVLDIVGLTNNVRNVFDSLMGVRDDYKSILDRSNDKLYNILGMVYDVEDILHSDGENEHYAKVSADYRAVMNRKNIQKKYDVTKFDDKKDFSEIDVVKPLLKIMFDEKTKRSRYKKVIEFAKFSDKVKDGSYMNAFIKELGGIDKASRASNLEAAVDQVNRIDEGLKLVANNNFGVINAKDIAKHIDVSTNTFGKYVAVLVLKDKDGNYVIKSASNKKSVCESLLSTHYLNHKNDDRVVNELSENDSKQLKEKTKLLLKKEMNWSYKIAA
jgi:hypothetical protein